MEFGHLSDEELAGIDFSLPTDSQLTLDTLKAAESGTGFDIHVGLSKWQDKSWIGTIFPPKLNPKEYLSEYARHFNTVELNATFYTTYSKEEMSKWDEKVVQEPQFSFCPKFPQTITHMRRFKNVEDITKRFYDGLQGIKEHLGPAFIQLGDNFTYKSFDDLHNYINSLTKTQRVFLEIRHKDWFSDLSNRHKLFSALRDAGIGTVITDAAGRRDCVHMELTIPEVMIRFVGNNLHKTDYQRLDAWVVRLKAWKEKGLQKVWFFIHEYDEVHAPEAAVYLIKQLNEHLGTNIKVPELLKDS